MSTSSRREREREEIREEIIRAARELFASQGYEAVTMRAVAEAIDYSPGTIYLHFRDKESLIAEICARDFAELSSQLTRLRDIADPVERLRRLGLAYVAFAMANPNQYRVMFMSERIAIPPERVGHDATDPEQDAYAFLKATIADCAAAGRFRPEADLKAAPQLIWAALHGLVSLRITSANDPWVKWPSVKRSASSLMDILLSGLLREAPRPGVLGRV